MLQRPMRLILAGVVLSLLPGTGSGGADVPLAESCSGRAVTTAGRHWYTEEHKIGSKDGHAQIETRYVATDGTPMAELSAEIGRARYLPRTRFVDHRDQYRYTIDPLPNGKVVRITETSGPHQRERSKTLAMHDRLMTFQGALLFIRDQIDGLEHGSRFVIYYLVPSRMRSYAVRIYKRSIDGSVLSLRMEMDTAAYRLLMPAMDLKIDTRSRRLLEFSGASNLLDDRDRLVNVRITYTCR
jgi:hypothetical protein